MNIFFKGLLVIVLLSLCGLSIFGSITLKDWRDTQNKVELMQQEQKATQSFENHALDTNKEIAQAGYNAVVAVAISGDVSQTQIAQASLMNTVMIFLIIIAVIGLLAYLDLRREKKHAQRAENHKIDYTKDEYQESVSTEDNYS